MNSSNCSVHSPFRGSCLYPEPMKRMTALLLALGLFTAQPALADQWSQSFSPGQARESVREGKTVPLSRIFKDLKREYGGYQLDAELYSSQDGNGSEYHIDWMTEDGRKVLFVVDAETGRILDRRGA